MINKKILITGGNGFIGSKVVALLRSREYSILAPSSSELNLFHYADVELFMQHEKPQMIIHLAWNITPGGYLESEYNFDWLLASLNLLKQFRQAGGERAFFAGSCFEYKYSNTNLKETDALSPNSYYGKCKVRLSELFLEYCAQTGLLGIWGRIFIAYGANDNPNKLFPYLINSLLNGQIANCSAGSQVRDLIYVEDIAEAISALMETPGLYGVYNIGSGHGVRLKDVMSLAGHLLQREDLIKFGVIPMREDEPAYIVGDVDKIYQATGWKARFIYEDGLIKIIQWLKNENN